MGERYFPWLLGLAVLFAFRVAAQLIQYLHPVPLLPHFDAWHGAVLPYSLLVLSQGIVIGMLTVILWRVRTDRLIPTTWKYRLCLGLGGVYFAVMAFRFAAGLTFLSDHAWFSKSLPAFFHMVLACFLLVLGHYLLRRSKAVR